MYIPCASLFGIIVPARALIIVEHRHEDVDHNKADLLCTYRYVFMHQLYRNLSVEHASDGCFEVDAFDN